MRQNTSFPNLSFDILRFIQTHFFFYVSKASCIHHAGPADRAFDAADMTLHVNKVFTLVKHALILGL